MRKHIQWAGLLLVLTLFTVSATAQDTQSGDSEPLRIVATTTQASDIARILTDGVPDVEIAALMGAGVDPHLYQPTESDVAAMNTADMVIYSGLNLEGQFDTVFRALSEQGVRTVPLGQPVKRAGFIIGGFDLSEELTNVDDPHFWFDPRNWEISVAELAEALAELDEPNAAAYTANAEAYIEQLTTLYDWANEAMSAVPEDKRYLVTSHDAFQYFGGGFGWTLFSVQGLSTEDEAGVGDIQGVVDFIIDNDVPVIFIESSLPPDTVEAVVEAVENAGGSLRVGVRELYSDAMGDTSTFGGTYIGMLGENVYTILQSYQCAGVEFDIPDWPEDLNATPPDDLLNPSCDAETN